jgi:hypothetical protein
MYYNPTYAPRYTCAVDTTHRLIHECALAIQCADLFLVRVVLWSFGLHRGVLVAFAFPFFSLESVGLLDCCELYRPSLGHGFKGRMLCYRSVGLALLEAPPSALLRVAVACLMMLPCPTVP